MVDQAGDVRKRHLSVGAGISVSVSRAAESLFGNVDVIDGYRDI